MLFQHVFQSTAQTAIGEARNQHLQTPAPSQVEIFSLNPSAVPSRRTQSAGVPLPTTVAQLWVRSAAKSPAPKQGQGKRGRRNFPTLCKAPGSAPARNLSPCARTQHRGARCPTANQPCPRPPVQPQSLLLRKTASKQGTTSHNRPGNTSKQQQTTQTQTKAFIRNSNAQKLGKQAHVQATSQPPPCNQPSSAWHLLGQLLGWPDT